MKIKPAEFKSLKRISCWNKLRQTFIIKQVKEKFLYESHHAHWGCGAAAVMSTMFVGDRQVQVQNTGGRLTACGGRTKAVELLLSPQHHSSTTAGHTAVEHHHPLETKHNTPDIMPVLLSHHTGREMWIKMVRFYYIVFKCKVC